MLRKLRDLSLPLLIVLALVINRFEFLTGRQSIVAIVAIESVLSLVLIWRVYRLQQKARLSRATGSGWNASIRDGINSSMPRPFAMLFLGEILMWVSLSKVVRRGWHTREGEFTYHRRSPVIGLTVVAIMTAPVELLVVQLIVPWDIIRWILLIAGVYSVLWIAGYAASYVVSPHVVGACELVLNKGAFAQLKLNYRDIQSITIDRSRLPDQAEGWGARVRNDVGYLAVGNRADMRVELKRPLSFEQLSGSSEEVSILRIAADRPEELMGAINKASLSTLGEDVIRSH